MIRVPVERCPWNRRVHAKPGLKGKRAEDLTDQRLIKELEGEVSSAVFTDSYLSMVNGHSRLSGPVKVHNLSEDDDWFFRSV